MTRQQWSCSCVDPLPSPASLLYLTGGIRQLRSIGGQDKKKNVRWSEW